ncbi:Gfo/Idh/MocA family protein [Coraliomargarita sp. W4R53]
MNHQPLQIGIIGASGYAGVLIDCLDKLIAAGEVCVSAAVIRSPDQIPERTAQLKADGCRIYTDWKDFLEQEVGKLDLCIIPTGIQYHKEMAVAALTAGYTVFLEKPIAATIEDAIAVAEAGRQSGGRITLGFQDLYMPSTRRVKDAVVYGEIGEIESICAIGLWPRNHDYYNRNNWAGCLKSGGSWVLDSPINNAFAHFVNLMLYWASPELGCSAGVSRLDAELYRARAIESFDTASFRMHTDCHVPIEFHASHSCESIHGPEILIKGSQGTIRWLMETRIEITTSEGVEVIDLEHTMDVRRIMFAEVAKWVRGDVTAAVCPVSQALGHAVCVNLLHRGLPIHDVDSIISSTDPKQPAIEGIHEAFVKCFEQGGLLSENGIGWAQPASSTSLPADLREAVESLMKTSSTTVSV